MLIILRRNCARLIPMSRDRRSLRAPAHDYRLPGAYILTLVTYRRRLLFSTVTETGLSHSALGHLVREEWQRASQVRPYVTVDEFVVMPNHLHGILIFTDHLSPEGPAQESLTAGSLGALVGQFKSRVTRRARELFGEQGRIWQRNYHERAIRGQLGLQRVRQYIRDNPIRWKLDRLYVQDRGCSSISVMQTHRATHRVAPAVADVRATSVTAHRSRCSENLLPLPAPSPHPHA